MEQDFSSNFEPRKIHLLIEHEISQIRQWNVLPKIKLVIWIREISYQIG